MSYKGVNHDLRVVNGGTIYMPVWSEGNDKWGNLKRPSVYLATTGQDYPWGTIYREGLRTFVYTQNDPTYFGQKGTGDGSINMGYLVESCSEYEILTDSVITATLGEYTIVVNMGAACAVNAYAGGMIGLKNSTGTRQTAGRSQQFMILSNTVQDGDNYVTFTLDGALEATLTTSADVVLSEHIYKMVRSPFSGPYGMAVGVHMQQAYASKYCWKQTGGPIGFLPIFATYEGAEAGGCIPVYAVGGIVQTTVAKATSTFYSGYEGSAYQVIGYTFPSTNIGGPEGTPADISITPHVFLTIFN